MLTFEKLKNVIEKYSISPDVILMSDSGWECCASDMDGMYYNQKANLIVFTQQCDEYQRYCNDPNWKALTIEELNGFDVNEMEGGGR